MTVGRARRASSSVEAAALSGLAAAVLLSLSVYLLGRQPGVGSSSENLSWYSDSENRFTVLLGLNFAPLGVVALLWFMAVIRRRLGEQEDQLFATVFFGSGIAFGLLTITAAVGAASPTLVVRFGDETSLNQSTVASSDSSTNASTASAAELVKLDLVATHTADTIESWTIRATSTSTLGDSCTSSTRAVTRCWSWTRTVRSRGVGETGRSQVSSTERNGCSAALPPTSMSGEGLVTDVTNTVPSPPTFTQLGVAPRSACPGGRVLVTAQIRNEGTDEIRITTRLLLGHAQEPQIWLGDLPEAGVPVGETVSVSGEVTVPLVEPGQYAIYPQHGGHGWESAALTVTAPGD